MKEINFYNLLNVASKRMEDVYSKRITSPSFKLNIYNVNLDFYIHEFPKHYEGIFEFLTSFISVWKLFSDDDKNVFSEFVIGQYLKEDLMWFMDVLSTREKVRLT